MKTLLYSFIVLCGLFGVSSTKAEEAKVCESANEKILMQVVTITLDEGRVKKIQDTENLIRLIAKLDPTDIELIDERVIILLASLLEYPDNGVRMWVAVALAQFEHVAEPALPALEAAYERTVDKAISVDVPLLPSTSAREEIANAIDVIKQKSAHHKASKKKAGK